MLYVLTRGVPLTATRVARTPPSPDAVIPVDPTPLLGAQLEGNRQARIAVIEYSDFQCPFCGQFARETFPQFEREFVQSGKVLFAFRQFPLEAIHANAFKAAEAAQCAAEQDRFWQMHSLLFAEKQKLDEPSLKESAARAGLKLDLFERCLRDESASRVRADAQTGKTLLVSGTPTFFVGTVQANGSVKIVKRFSGAVPFAQFKETVEGVLAAVPASGVARLSK